jgi:hypothetical protein
MGFISDARQKVRSWLEKGAEETTMADRQAKNRVVRKRYRQAAERLMENSSLRDELNDEQAKRALDWGNEYLKKVADETADLADSDADHILETQSEQVSGVIHQANQLTRAINNKDPRQLSDHYTALTKNLDKLKGTAGELPLNIMEWLSLSEEKNNWLLAQLANMVDGEEE